MKPSMDNDLIKEYGTFWARNHENMEAYTSRLRKKHAGGIYVLYNGSAPVYIGKGHIRSRVTKRHRSGSKSAYWDHFSWFVVNDENIEHELEALLLKTLPFYLRCLNLQEARFDHDKRKKCRERKAETSLKRPKSVAAFCRSRMKKAR